MERVYRAYDGAEFRSNYSCKKYEMSVNILNDGTCVFWDDTGKRIEIVDSDNIIEVTAAKFGSVEHIECFNAICRAHSLCLIPMEKVRDKQLAWVELDDANGWIPVKQLVSRLHRLMTSLESISSADESKPSRVLSLADYSVNLIKYILEEK